MSTITEQAVSTNTDALTFTVNEPDLRDALSAALLSASTDGTVPVLCAVKVERQGNQLLIWSTDRYRLTRVTITPADNMGNTDGADWSVLLDTADAKRIVAALQKRTARNSYAMPATVTLEPVPDTEEHMVTVATLGGRTTVRSREGQYPAVTVLLERDTDDLTNRGEICFNPRYMTDLCKMPGRAKNETVHVRFTGPKGLKMRASWEDGSVAYEYLLQLARPAGEPA